MSKVWINDKMHVVDDEVASEIERLQEYCNRPPTARAVEYCQGYDLMKAENKRLRAALEEIASQGRPVEFDDEEKAIADYEAAYDLCVLTAREALRDE